MRRLTLQDPSNTRILIVRAGRPLGGTLQGVRQRKGEEALVTISLDREDPDTPAKRLTLPASQVWVDERWEEKWADAESSYRMAEHLRIKAEEAQEICTCGHGRRAHHRGGVDDGGCQGCECEAYADLIASLRLEVRENRDKATRYADLLREWLEAAAGPRTLIDLMATKTRAELEGKGVPFGSGEEATDA